MQAVRQAVEAAVAKDGDRIEVRLDPPELGRVRITLTPQEHGVLAQVTADRPEALDLMRRHADQLGAELSRLGHARVDLSFAEDGGGAGRGGGGEPSPAAEATGEPPAAPARRLMVSAGMDLRV